MTPSQLPLIAGREPVCCLSHSIITQAITSDVQGGVAGVRLVVVNLLITRVKVCTLDEVRQLLSEGQYCDHQRSHDVAVEVVR